MQTPQDVSASGFRCDAVLFDLDGTLVDSAPDITTAIDATLVALGQAPTGEALVRLWVGNGATRLLERALRHAGIADNARLEAARDLFFEHYAAHLADRSRLYDGVAPALEQLHASGLMLAVCTNKPARFVRPLLEGMRIDRYFSAVLGGDELAQRKPHPAPLLHLAGTLRVAPGRCLMVGDSRNDVEAARAAGMPVIAVSYGYNHGDDVRDCAPDAVVDSLLELLMLLR